MSEAAVIIPHYNDSTRLARCLDALAKEPADQRARAEIIVADNGSTEDLSPLQAAHPDVRFVTESTKGAAAARNRGVSETTAARLIFLDADCRPLPGWLARALDVSLTEQTIVGGRVDTFDETPPPRSGAEAFEAVFAFHQRSYIEKKGFSVTANLVTTRGLFLATGPFIVGVSEDLEWCQRASLGGARLVYDDAMAVEHPTRQDWPALKRKWKRTTDEAFGLITPGFAGRLGWIARAIAVAGSALIHVPKVLRSSRLTGRGEKLAALATLFRLRLQRAGWMIKQAIRFTN